MAILSKNGQLLANASQRTLVFDTNEQLQAFKASLPTGVNVDESFDIYVKETGTVYAAGVPFKLREIVEEDNLQLWFSVDGTGDGLTPENPADGNMAAGYLVDYASRYDFNNRTLICNFAPGKYVGFSVFQSFLNCSGVNIAGTHPITLKADGTLDETQCAVFSNIFDHGQNAGPTFGFRSAQNFWLDNVGIVCNEGAVAASNGARVNLHGVAIQYTNQPSMNIGTPRGVIVAEGGGTQIMPMNFIGCTNFGLCQQVIADVQAAEDPAQVMFDDAFFLAIDGGTI